MQYPLLHVEFPAIETRDLDLRLLQHKQQQSHCLYDQKSSQGILKNALFTADLSDVKLMISRYKQMQSAYQDILNMKGINNLDIPDKSVALRFQSEHDDDDEAAR